MASSHTHTHPHMHALTLGSDIKTHLFSSIHLVLRRQTDIISAHPLSIIVTAY